MAYLNANIPVQYAQIKKEYLYDLKKHHGEVEDCIIFGITSIAGQAILWHAIMENGAVFYRLPLSAFIQRGFQPSAVPSSGSAALAYVSRTSWSSLIRSPDASMRT